MLLVYNNGCAVAVTVRVMVRGVIGIGGVSHIDNSERNAAHIAFEIVLRHLALAGAICRCTGHIKVKHAVRKAAEVLRSSESEVGEARAE